MSHSIRQAKSFPLDGTGQAKVLPIADRNKVVQKQQQQQQQHKAQPAELGACMEAVTLPWGPGRASVTSPGTPDSVKKMTGIWVCTRAGPPGGAPTSLGTALLRTTCKHIRGQPCCKFSCQALLPSCLCTALGADNSCSVVQCSAMQCSAVLGRTALGWARQGRAGLCCAMPSAKASAIMFLPMQTSLPQLNTRK